jgi:2-C-methyl-D-erythritol 2,4-cyclodiphosphate synthase
VRIGTGYDVHPLVPGRKLVLGGIEIPYENGLDGWSDADVLVHAMMDALLGAAALGDIGRHFPPGDPAYKGVSSLTLLAKVGGMLEGRGLRVMNVDNTIIAERPRLAGYVDAMRGKLAGALGIEIGRVSVKASTNNGVGALGRGEGIAALTVALVEEGENSKS